MDIPKRTGLTSMGISGLGQTHTSWRSGHVRVPLLSEVVPKDAYVHMVELVDQKARLICVV